MRKNDVLKAVNKKNTNNKTTTSKKKKTVSKKRKEVKKVVPKTTPEVIVKEEIINKEIVEENIPFKIKLKRFGIKLLIALVIFIALLLAFFTLTEYKPKDVEKLTISGEGFFTLNPNDTFSIMTWNVGYGALGDNADFFMDNGTMVKTADRNRINKNLASIRNVISNDKPQIIFLQEVDVSSTRASHVNELSLFRNHLYNYSSAFGTNFKVTYLPYPIGEPIGRVHSGIATFSKYTMSDAKRIQLPSSFIWPVSTVNLKRCLVVTRIPIKDNEKELVLINLHLEAYDSGKGKELQTKKLLEVMNKEKKKGNYVIVGGDFNQTFDCIDSSQYPLQDKVWKPGEINIKDFGKGWNFLMDNTNPTCRSLDKPYVDADKDKFQYYLIDGFIVTDNIKVNSVKTENLDFVASDHNPVIMNVTLS